MATNWKRGATYGTTGAIAGGTIGSFVPVVGTAIGAGIGGLAGGLYGLFSEDPAQQVLNRYKRSRRGSRYVNPQLLNRATQLAGGMSGVDPKYREIAHNWAQGKGGVDYNLPLAREMLAGGIPDHTANALNRQIGNRFNQLRRRQGASAARRGVNRGSIGQRLQSDIYASERNAITDAYANNELARQRLGLGILSQADQSKLSRQALGGQHLAGISDLDRSYQALGFSVLSDADRLRMAGDQFDVNLELATANAGQARSDAMLQAGVSTLGNLYSGHMAGKDRAAELAMLDSHHGDIMGLLSQLSAPQAPGVLQSHKPSLIQEKARNLYGGPFLKPGASLDSAFKRKSVLSSRTGGGNPMARSANPAMSGSRGN